MRKYSLYITLFLIGIWWGYVAGISFMEAPLKFRAPGITLPLGLGIGKIVFGALNRAEWVLFLFALGFSILAEKRTVLYWCWTILATLLLLETFWLLPVLNSRAESIISGQYPPPSYHHWCYIVADIVKLIMLIISGVIIVRLLTREK